MEKGIKKYLKILLGILAAFTFSFSMSNNTQAATKQIDNDTAYTETYNKQFAKTFDQKTNNNETVNAIKQYPKAVFFSRNDSSAYFSAFQAKNLGMDRKQAIKVANYFNHLNYLEKNNNIFVQVEGQIAGKAGQQFTSLRSNIDGFQYYYGFSNLRYDAKVRPGDMRIAAVGDSITYGWSLVNWQKNQYPLKLDELLGRGYAVKNFGVSGTTAQNTADQPYTLTNSYKQSLAYNPNIVILMFGTNDARGINWQNSKSFKKQYTNLVNKYQNLKSHPRIILASPLTVYNGSPDGMDKSDTATHIKILKSIVPIEKQVAKEKHLQYVDTHGLTANKPYLFEHYSGLHPTVSGAQYIAQIFKSAIQNNQ